MPNVSGLQRLLNICDDDYGAEHEIALNCNKTINVSFCPKMYKQPASSKVFLNVLRVQFSDRVKYLCVSLNASLKDDDVVQRQVKSLHCAAPKLRDIFAQCFIAVKKTQFRAYCMPMYTCQVWSKYTDCSMKCLQVAYNNAYRIMRYIPWNVSVRPHQVSYRVTTFDTLLRNNLYRFLQRCASNFFYTISSNVWCFLQIFVFAQLFNASA